MRRAVRRNAIHPAAEQENALETAVEGFDKGCKARKSSVTWMKTIFASVGANTSIKKGSFTFLVRQVEGFPEHLFKIFNRLRRNDVLGVQELIGGFALLRSNNQKSIDWFKKYFEVICEDENIITFEQFSKALQDDVFVDKFFKLFDLNGDGEILIKEFITILDRLQCASVDTKWYFWIQEMFDVDSKDDRNITFEQFRKHLYLKESFFAQRFYAIFDTNGDGSISMRELVSGLTMLVQGTEHEKLKFLFKVYDIDGNGELKMEEVRTVLESCMEESQIQFHSTQTDELTDVFFEKVDADDNGQITFEEFESFLKKYPDVVENLNISAGHWLNPMKTNKMKRSQRKKTVKETFDFIRKNVSSVLFKLLYLLVNLDLCVWVGTVRSNESAWMILARMFGMCLNFNGTFVLVLMLKSCLTWLRSSRIGKYIPIDDHIKFHKTVAYIILLQSLLHFLGHLGRYIWGDSGHKLSEYLISTRTDEGWLFGTAGITGVLLCLVFAVMALFSLPGVRRQGHFELFYFTHHLYIGWWILLLLHAPNFWKWFIVPAFLYLLERISRSSIANKVRYGKTYIEKGIVLPSKVTHLVIPRSAKFRYKPGDYVLVNIPEIARYEWHPFTISSSPDMTDYLWLHIRAVGTWTKKLHDYYLKEKTSEHLTRRQRILAMNSLRYFRNEARLHSHATPVPETSDTERVRKKHLRDSKHVSVSNVDKNGNFVRKTEKSLDQLAQLEVAEQARMKKLKIYVDGPYGTPVGHFFEAEHAVLISSGIGVTPFASILQTIMLRYKEATHTCPSCEHCWLGKTPFSLKKLQKVDFFWINRDQAAFEWFLSLLTQLELEQSEDGGIPRENFLDTHIYMTSALKTEDMKALGLQLALELIHEKKDKDLITGLKTRTKPGRPDWEQVFQDLTAKDHGKISVFFCGNPLLGKTLKSYCRKYQCEFRKENF